MTKKVYYLKTCSTCQRILKELDLPSDWELQNIKEEPMTEVQVEEMKNLAGSYEALFSKRSMKYKEWNLKEKNLSEEEMKNYILEEYTFLKRPVFIYGEQIFVGNAQKEIDRLKEAL